ncbi:IS110 family transposase [Azospirillum canadense]|uniref:IS110 family transposase n=1 Tax=Azospirillum canadense TaxID=403962 RepID=UPI002225E2F5|nr:IS110 family transposase [Azospirillum canadense]MCW2242565.1 transposase [Azospirillum canadense]
MDEEERHWFVGIDWASEAHQVRVSDAKGRTVGEKTFPHGGAGLADMAAWILALTRTSADQVFVAIEVPHGPVVESLMERGFRVHSINPKQLDRFRDRFSPAGAKDDSRDAEALADALRTDPRCFRPLAPLDPTVVELREWSRIAEDLRDERNRLSNRIRDQLWRYYPQILELTEDVAADWFLDLWNLAPTPDKARRVREDTLARFLKRHRIRRLDAAQVLDRLRQPAIRVAPGTTEAAVAHVKAVSKRLDLVNRQIAEAEHQLDRLTERLAEPAAGQETDALGPSPGQRDVTILRSLPGVGRIVLATLLAEAWNALQR